MSLMLDVVCTGIDQCGPIQALTSTPQWLVVMDTTDLCPSRSNNIDLNT